MTGGRIAMVQAVYPPNDRAWTGWHVPPSDAARKIIANTRVDALDLRATAVVTPSGPRVAITRPCGALIATVEGLGLPDLTAALHAAAQP